jgi:predicted O-methyltransferase YrrM
MYLGEKAKDILEIGFNAGRSALLFLLSNTHSKLVCFDYCTHKYTEKCYEYLRKEFGDRIELIKGDSNKTLTEYYYRNSKRFDLLHIDGGHDNIVANNDFFNCYKLAKEDSIIIWDDVWLQSLQILWNKYKERGYVEEFKLLETPMYSHIFGKVIKKNIKSVYVQWQLVTNIKKL